MKLDTVLSINEIWASQIVSVQKLVSVRIRLLKIRISLTTNRIPNKA